jgi:hypothetical protein
MYSGTIGPGVYRPGVLAVNDAVGRGIPICANKACAGVCCTLLRSPTVLRAGVVSPFLGDDELEGAGDSDTDSEIVLSLTSLVISSAKEVSADAAE